MERKIKDEEQAAKYRLHYFRRNDIPELTESELEEESARIYQSLMGEHSVRPVKSSRLWYRAGAAAAVALIVAGLFYFNQPEAIKSPGVEVVYSNDIAPGKLGATLTLANGKKIDLSSAPNGIIADQDGVSVSKTGDGKLVYNIKNTKSNIQEFNTLSTVNGQQYEVVLPDGSKIWLNAASTLTYPANFAKLNKRKVDLKGEAYFEVAKDKSRPFIVRTDRQEVEVLGTHFNVNSYGNEDAIKTTLLEGSVRVSDSKLQKVLLPGQQSLLTGNSLRVSKADVDEVVAWKNGDFIFKNEEVSAILRQISRWYNVEIVNSERSSKLRLSGTVSKSRNLSTVLKGLEVTGEIKFKIEGKRVTVLE
ncbi:MAG: DUF4974 domain-containing protein [Sphingobacteriales bacterium]|nr:MAG: DUF4974 domain-containing protein [Sphingobacteriales bacterium]